MSKDKIKVVVRGSSYRVFLPNGTELRQIQNLQIETGRGKVPKLVLSLVDFEFDSELTQLSHEELYKFGLREEDFEGRQ